VPGGVSGGETEMVGLAFLSSLTKISEFDAPIIIENPFGVLGEKEIENLVQSLSKFFENKQVFFLMNPKDFQGNIKQLISPSLLKCVKLEHNESEKKTVFKPTEV